MVRFIYRHRFEFIILIFGFFYMLFFSRYGLDVEDEGWFLYASKLISQGLTPYRDFSLHVTPGSLYMQALMFKLFGATVIVGRYSMIFLGLFVALMLFYISREIIPSRLIAAISSVIFIFWGIPHIRYPWYGWYALAFGLIVPYLVLKHIKTGRNLFLILAGIFCSLTFLMKQNIGALVTLSVLLFVIIKDVFLQGILKQRFAIRFIKDGLILSFGFLVPLAITALYFYLNKALSGMVYYIFRHASAAAWNRFIFIPFPHIENASVFILFSYLPFCYFLYRYISRGKKPVYGIPAFLILFLLAAVGFLFIKNIERLDSMYILDHIKAGSINGFFNLCMASVIFGWYVFLKQYFRKKALDYKNLALLFLALWALFYIWSSLCISRDHLHLVLGMVPAYVLVPFLLGSLNDKLFILLNSRARDAGMVKGYSDLIVIFLPLLFICFIGYFSALKNEGLRSILPPVTQMDAMLHIKNARGIMVSRQDKEAITGIVDYITQNTSKDERIFDTFKDTLFYFLSDRLRPSRHLVMTSDVMRESEQDGIIESLDKDGVKLIITQKLQWDDSGRYLNPQFNPLTFKVWVYIVNNYERKMDFGKYYILRKRN